MSEFGASQYPGSRVAYHGIDPVEFWPISAEKPAFTSTGQKITTKREAKLAFGFDPDGFLVGRIDTNSERKDWAATWKALVPFVRRHSEVQVHFHGNPKPDVNFGVDMENLMGRYPDIERAKRVFFPGLHNTFTGWKQQDMNVLVNAFDVRLSTSHGEGAGLGDLEAIACGVPVIAQNVTATPEMVGPGGILLEPERTTTPPSGEDQFLPDIAAFSEALEKFYRSKGLRRTLSAAGIAHSQQFRWDVTAAIFDEEIRLATHRKPQPVEDVPELAEVG
jgi:glycosyltransferase involved in cell wall biosynthesis